MILDTQNATDLLRKTNLQETIEMIRLSLDIIFFLLMQVNLRLKSRSKSLKKQILLKKTIKKAI